MVKVKYILINFFKLFLISSISLLLLFFIIQLLDDLPDIISKQQEFLLSTYLLSLPASFVQISPLITLLSGMFLVLEMVKTNEIKVLEISGINVLKIFSILLFASLIVSGFTFYIENRVVPFTSKSNIYGSPISFSSASLLFNSEKVLKNKKFINVELSIISEKGEITSIRAKEAIYSGNNLWNFKKGTVFKLQQNGVLKRTENFELKTMKLPITEEILLLRGKNPDFMGISELKKLITEFKKIDVSPFFYKTYYYEKISYPLLNFFILFVVFPFFLVKQKITRFFVLSSTIVLGFFSYGIYSFFIALARAGKIPPFIGGWGFHIIISIFLILTILRGGPTSPMSKFCLMKKKD